MLRTGSFGVGTLESAELSVILSWDRLTGYELHGLVDHEHHFLAAVHHTRTARFPLDWSLAAPRASRALHPRIPRAYLWQVPHTRPLWRSRVLDVYSPSEQHTVSSTRYFVCHHPQVDRLQRFNLLLQKPRLVQCLLRGVAPAPLGRVELMGLLSTTLCLLAPCAASCLLCVSRRWLCRLHHRQRPMPIVHACAVCR